MRLYFKHILLRKSVSFNLLSIQDVMSYCCHKLLNRTGHFYDSCNVGGHEMKFQAHFIERKGQLSGNVKGHEIIILAHFAEE